MQKGWWGIIRASTHRNSQLWLVSKLSTGRWLKFADIDSLEVEARVFLVGCKAHSPWSCTYIFGGTFDQTVPICQAKGLVSQFHGGGRRGGGGAELSWQKPTNLASQGLEHHPSSYCIVGGWLSGCLPCGCDVYQSTRWARECDCDAGEGVFLFWMPNSRKKLMKAWFCLPLVSRHVFSYRKVAKLSYMTLRISGLNTRRGTIELRSIKNLNTPYHSCIYRMGQYRAHQNGRLSLICIPRNQIAVFYGFHWCCMLLPLTKRTR